MVDVSEIYDMNPKAVVMETEDEFLKKHDLAYYRQFNTWGYNSSMDNMIRQWNSIEGVWNLMESTGIRYDRVSFLRSDVFYASPIFPLDEHIYAAIPKVDFYPVNDRAFMGSYEPAKIWGTERFPRVAAYLANITDLANHDSEPSKVGLHSETFLRDAILPSLTNFTTLDICFMRVRCHGQVRFDDCYCRNKNSILKKIRSAWAKYCPSHPSNPSIVMSSVTGLHCDDSGLCDLSVS